MKLGEYLRENKITQEQFAEKIGIGYSTLKNIIAGKFEVRLSVALKIQKETKGKVRCEDLWNPNEE